MTSVLELPKDNREAFTWPPPLEGWSEEVDVQQEVIAEGESMILRGVLTPAECEYIIAATEASGFDVLGEKERTYRTNDRQVMMHAALADCIHRRIAPFIPQELMRPRGHGQLADELSPWDVVGCNPLMRFCKYHPGGFFKCHQDGKFVLDAHTESVWTVNMYLNGGFTGGATNFLEAHYKNPCDRVITRSVAPEQGMALVFLHPLVHEGDTLVDGVKYLARTEVLYRHRVVDSVEDEAMGIFREAEYHEEQGNMKKAVSLYKKAFRMCPSLEERMR
eukprot:TRINITY_DN6528_c0_g1_i1.p2 TRINITY_DN6528_c0_g1~~TRINITY_DN6528_c0_g1_i1.p2  ORF type:complete len:277 (+),score=86.77 TRINITY_DN6528_c0_g1_i1:87-917(+)